MLSLRAFLTLTFNEAHFLTFLKAFEAVTSDLTEVFINDISYPICPESGIVTVKCAAKTTYASAELYELHEVDSIVCSSFILLPAENVWSAGLRTMLYFFALLYCFLGIAIIADVSAPSVCLDEGLTLSLLLCPHCAGFHGCH